MRRSGWLMSGKKVMNILIHPGLNKIDPHTGR